MSILIKDLSYIVTQDRLRRILRNRSILVADGRIESIAPSEELGGLSSADQVIDGRGYAAIPGMIDLHNHSVQTIFRGDLDGLPLMAWLRRIDLLYGLLDRESLVDASRLSFYEKVLSGVTSVLDMERGVEEAVEAARQVGIRLFEAVALFDTIETGESGLRRIRDVDEELRLAETYLKKYREDPMIEVFPGPVGFPSSSFELMEEAARLARRLHTPLHYHFAETPVNDRLARNLNYAGEFVELERRGFFGENLILAHAIHVDDYEIDSLAKYGVSVAHCPSSNLKLLNGVAPIWKMVSHGVNVGLGTDGAASNDSEDIFREMKEASLIQRIYEGGIIDAQKVFDMATVNAAEALGRRDLGSIEVGKRADIVLLNLKDPSLHPLDNLLENLVFSADRRCVDTVIIDGEILVRGGRHVSKTLEEQVLTGLERAREKLAEKMNG